ncbi:MAG TPA: TIGR04255 family protein [Methylotenera sp.]|nr:TIGR04255 family protein [Methylotenera sp.]HPV45805.1 TIGR04255 family protein [Methylotenera sp.]
MNYPHLNNAPIIEAVIDFRFLPALNIEHSEIGKLHEAILKEYPVKQENKEIQLGFTVGPEQTTQQTVSDSVVGYRFENTDKKYVFMATKNGFSLSKLAPYDDWSTFLNEAKKISKVYFGILGHQNITRTAIRYVNVIEITEEKADFDDYLVAGPKVPEGLPNVVSEFLLRNVIPCVDQKAYVTIVQAYGEGDQIGKAKVVLDIDVVCVEEYNSSSDKQWELLDILRTLKNNAFFKSLHPKALEKYK